MSYSHSFTVTWHKICIHYKREKSHFKVDKLGRQHFNQVTIISNGTNTNRNHCHLTDALSRTQQHFCNSPAKEAQPESKDEKMADKPKLRDILQNICPLFLKTVWVIKNKESLSSCHRPEETKETWRQNVLYPGDGVLGQGKDMRGKSSDVWMKCGV